MEKMSREKLLREKISLEKMLLEKFVISEDGFREFCLKPDFTNTICYLQLVNLELILNHWSQ